MYRYERLPIPFEERMGQTWRISARRHLLAARLRECFATPQDFLIGLYARYQF